jgi:cytochrome c2
MTRRPVLVVLSAAALAGGCGGSDEEQAAPARPTGEAALGKQLFTKRDCISCHSLSAAQSISNYGPNLDHLPQYAKRAGKPLEQFVRQSIRDPGAYTEPGWLADRMPRYYKALPPRELESLVRFLVESTEKSS